MKTIKFVTTSLAVVTICMTAIPLASVNATTIENVSEQAAPVIVKFLNEDGKELAPQQVLTGNLKESYQANFIDIKGHQIFDIPKNSRGHFTAETQTVNFIYKTNDSVVNVNHVSENGTILAEETLNGKYGESYETNSKEFSTYELLTTPANAYGTFVEDEQTITYVYTRKTASTPVTVRHLDAQTGAEIAPSIEMTGKIGERYHAEILVISGYTFNSTFGDNGVFSNTSGSTVEVYYDKN